MEPLSEGLLAAADWFGSALCHQWDSHSYVINGVPLCLCARCTGLYLGALLTLVYLAARTRGPVGMPRPPYLAVFLLFFVVWAGDGVNSFLTTLRGAPFLYPPQNLIRLTTGTCMGIGLGSLVFAVLSSLIKPSTADPTLFPLYARARDFLLLLAFAAILVAIVESQWEWLLYPLTAILLVAMIVVITVFWIGIASSFSEQPNQPAVARRNVLIALALTFLVLNAMAIARLFLISPLEPPI